jgi:hypothetical protein
MGEGERGVEVGLGGGAVADPAEAIRVSPLIAEAIAQPTAWMNWVARLPLMLKKPARFTNTSPAAAAP